MIQIMWILITGASSGIGRACVEYLIKQDPDINIVATARDAESIAKLNTLQQVQATYLDVTDQESITGLIYFLRQEEITIDVLINNAGILHLGLALNTSREELLEIFETNLFGLMHLCQALFDDLQATTGKIINISSDQGLVTVPYSTIYSMTKYGLEAFSEGLREEVKYYNIDVSLIEPGNISTTIRDKALQELKTRKVPEKFENQFNEMKEVFENYADEFGSSPDPHAVARLVWKIIQQKNPMPRYFLGTKDETKYVIQTLMERIAEINQTSPAKLSDDELRQELEFVLNLYTEPPEQDQPF